MNLIDVLSELIILTASRTLLGEQITPPYDDFTSKMLVKIYTAIVMLSEKDHFNPTFCPELVEYIILIETGILDIPGWFPAASRPED